MILNSKLVPPGYLSDIRPTVKMTNPYNSEIILEGELSRYGCPEILVTISGKSFMAILDTGAYNCRVNKDLAAELNLKPISTSEQRHPTLGIKKALVFNSDFKVNNRDFPFNEDFHEMEEYLYPIIIGSIFIMRCKELTIYGNEGYFRLAI